MPEIVLQRLEQAVKGQLLFCREANVAGSDTWIPNQGPLINSQLGQERSLRRSGMAGDAVLRSGICLELLEFGGSATQHGRRVRSGLLDDAHQEALSDACVSSVAVHHRSLPFIASPRRVQNLVPSPRNAWRR